MTGRRSAAVPLLVTSMLAAGLTGCSSDSDDESDSTHQAVCVDEDDVRVDDDRCDDERRPGYVGGFAWYFLAVGARYPPFGGRVTGGSVRRPSGSVVSYGGTRRDGGTASRTTVSRGGFGGRGGGSGG